VEGPDPLIRLQGTIEGKLQEKLRSIHSYKGLPEQERLRIVRGFLDSLFSDLSGRTKNSFVRHIKNLLKGSAAQDRIKQMLETLSALEAAIKPHVKNVKIVISLWDILSAARIQLTEHALQHSIPADISEQKMTEKALRASEERYRALVEGVNEFIMVIQDGKAVYANPKMLHDASMSMEEFAQKPFFDFIYKEDLPVVKDYYSKRLEGDTAHHSYPFRIVDNKGQVRWMQGSSIPIAWDQRPAVLVLLTDISLLKHTEESLLESEKKFRDIAQLTPQIIYEIDASYRLTFFNKEAKRMLGYAQEDIHQDFDIFTLFPEEERSRVRHNFKQIIKEGSSHGNEYTMVRNDGTSIPVIAYSAPVFRNGNFAGFRGVIIDISERKKTEDDLRLNEERLEAVLRLNQMVSSDTHEITDFALEEAVRLTKSTIGYLAFLNEDETTLTMYSWSVVAMGECAITDKPITYPVHKTGLWGEAVRQRRPIITNDYNAPNPLKRGYPEGHVKLTRHMNVPIFEGNRIVIVAGVGNKPAEYDESDVQQLTLLMQGMWGLISRKLADEARRESEQMYRSVINNIQDVFYRSDKNGRLLMGSPSGVKVFGYDSYEEMIGLPLEGFWVNPEDREGLLSEIRAHGSVQDFEGLMKKKDGMPFHVSFTTHFYYDDAGNILGTEGVIRDITKRKQAEQALQASEAKYRNIFENAVEGFFQSSPEGRFLNVNPAMARMCGYASPEDMINSITDIKLQFYVNPEERRAYVKRLEESGIDENFEHQVYRKDGSIIWISTNTRAVRDVSGNIIYFEGTHEDITKRKKVELELTASELFLKQTQSIARLGGWKANPHTNYLEWTDGIYDIIGAPRDYKPGLAEGLKYFLPEYILHIEEKVINCLATGETFVMEAEVVTEAGKRLWTEVRGLAPIIQGGRSYVAGTLQDITARKQLESQLFQAQKMEAVGTLAGGVAHDFNNILSAIMGYASLLQLKIERDSPLSSYIAQILTSSERAAQLTQSLLTFSRKQQITMKPFLLNDAIANIQKLLRRLLTEDIELKTHLAQERLVVLGDVNQIGQVVMNLVTNARDAMPAGGVISIYTSRFTMDGKFVTIHGFGKPGEYAQIMVSDTGTGIDEHILPKIFEPFFTTKAVGKGTGLGLSLVYGIVDQHNGYIDVRSRPDKGTSFFIYLPLITQSIETKGAQGIKVALTGTEKILVAEDNKEVRNLISMVLTENGYTVITAEDGLEAIRIFSEQSVDMVILDVIMPKMNGKEVLESLKKQQPSLKALFMSGYTYDIIQEKGISQEGVDLILKPLKPDEMLRKVRELLDS